MSVADSRLIALLNHDDLWLPANLETAVGTAHCEWFFGRAVWILGLQRSDAATRLEMSIASTWRDQSRQFRRGVH